MGGDGSCKSGSIFHFESIAKGGVQSQTRRASTICPSRGIMRGDRWSRSRPSKKQCYRHQRLIRGAELQNHGMDVMTADSFKQRYGRIVSEGVGSQPIRRLEDESRAPISAPHRKMKASSRAATQPHDDTCRSQHPSHGMMRFIGRGSGRSGSPGEVIGALRANGSLSEAEDAAGEPSASPVACDYRWRRTLRVRGPPRSDTTLSGMAGSTCDRLKGKGGA
ncbi:hypothetical protein VTN00DRAFT_3953 [Thermoascus crustaceus]|uniref:uncharacterized protein n=1 Tax=Thermoascus crustaceus TaxID=5088 RepID=UPI0037438272